MKDIINNDRLIEFKVHVMEGLNINSTIGNIDSSLLMYAIQNKAPKIGKYLVESGANINHKNSFGDTALIEASSMGYDKIVGFLLKRKAKSNIKNGMGENALYKAVLGHNLTRFSDNEQKNKYIKIISKLLNNNSPVNITPIQSKHLIFHVINTENSKIFKMVIEDGIKQDLQVLKHLLERLRQSEGLSEQKYFIQMLKILLKIGVKPKNLLHTATNLEIAKLLIAAGDEPSKFYDNKKFLSKDVREFLYPFDYTAFRKRREEKRKKGKKTLLEKMGL